MAICDNCNDEFWVCESHQDKSWNEKGCMCDAGMPCPICNPSNEFSPPKMPPGMEVVWDRNSVTTMQCSGCGKDIPIPGGDDMRLDKADTGIEGYIARNSLKPAAGFCNEKCLTIYNNRKLN